MLKRFLLFVGDQYYPGGGWDDFRDSFDSLPDALIACADIMTQEARDWWHIVDSVTSSVVKRSDGEAT